VAAEFEVMKATYVRLNAFSALTALLADGADGVRSYVPQDQANVDADFPFVVIGDLTSIPFDADDMLGFEMTVTVHCFDRARGPGSIMSIMGQVYNALNRYDLPVTGMHTVDVLWDDTAEVLLEPDGLTFHGVQRFRITITGE